MTEDTTLSPQVQEEANVIDLHFAVTEARQQGLKWGIIRKVQQSPQAMADYLAHFMTTEDGSRYLTHDEAMDVIDELTTAQVTQAFEAIFAQQKEAAAPEA